MAAQPREFAGADALARQANAEALESSPKLVEFLDLLSGMLANEPALIRLFDGETIAFQPMQGLPNGRSADFQLTCDCVGPERRPGSKAPLTIPFSSTWYTRVPNCMISGRRSRTCAVPSCEVLPFDIDNL